MEPRPPGPSAGRLSYPHPKIKIITGSQALRRPTTAPGESSGLTRAQAVDIWTQLSDVMAHAEELGLDIAEVQALIDSGTHPDPGVLDDLQRRLEEQSKAAQALATMLGYGGGWSQDNE